MVATKKFRNSVVRNLAPNSASFWSFCGKFRIIWGFWGKFRVILGVLPKIPYHFGGLAAEFRLKPMCKPPRVKRYFFRDLNINGDSIQPPRGVILNIRAAHCYFPCCSTGQPVVQ